MQSNNWVTNGTLGSKEAVLVFRTSVLTANPAASSSMHFDYPESESTSTSSTCTELSTKAQSNDKCYINSLPKVTRRIDNETFNFSEKKSKKRYLESSESASSASSSCSSSSSLTSENTEMEKSINESKNNQEEHESDKLSENKENVIVEHLDKSEMPAALFNITYKFINTETRLLRKILVTHGLNEVSHDAMDFNLLWTGNQLKPDMLRNLSPFQRINHFPRCVFINYRSKFIDNLFNSILLGPVS